MKINETPELLGHTWWWRGGSNSAIGSFDIRDGYLFMDFYRIKVKKILVQISPIPRFDFILLDIEGEEKNIADKNDYKWMDSGSFYNASVIGRLDESNYYFRLPYNMVITAKFGLPNNEVFSDTRLEIMLNKLLFREISFDDFVKWYNHLSRILKRVDEFYIYLKENPMLGMNHDVGKWIHDKIKELSTIDIENEVYFRARELKKMAPYCEEEMWNPPAGEVQIGEGRYNHFGRSYLYLANNEKTAFKEVIPPWHRTCSMAKFKIAKCKNILDLRRQILYNDDTENLDLALVHYVLVYEGTISKEVENELIKDEYVVPRFLADCARSYGFQGIIFNSTKEPAGENLVIFNPDALREMGRIEMGSKPYLYHI